MSPRLFCFGYGFTAQTLAAAHPDWEIWGTGRQEKSQLLDHERYFCFDGEKPVSGFERIADKITHILLSIPPTEEGDPVFKAMGDTLAALPNLKWIGYLSTTGVYGDLKGGEATEATPCNPSGSRAARRVKAEENWKSLADAGGLPLHIFRLPGIYGPGRNQLVSLRKGKAHRIVKKNHVFSRIHVADLANILHASMQAPNPGRIYNVADDLPAPPQDVVTFAAELLRMEPPPLQDYKTADMSPMARSFYADNKFVSNVRIKTELGITLIYPTYKEGLTALSQSLEP
ncbi:MAG: SDR family oxidoreductase [Sneathiellales bacterium]|nr:SDR family oxidoreductase [Sneathiellales bacterium]